MRSFGWLVLAALWAGFASCSSPETSVSLLAMGDAEALARSGTAVEIFDGHTLTGWRLLGDADYSVEDAAILGVVGGGGQSFLVTERSFGDFVLDVELRNEDAGNSGIQVRSHVRDSGRLYGYQIEIDPSERAWSGGLYDEARRGWLDDLSDNEPGRAAFRPGEWNHYRIACVGPCIRAWVNGVPTADHMDTADLSGVIGLQVHSGNNTRVRWRGFVLADLGSRSWEKHLDIRTNRGWTAGSTSEANAAWSQGESGWTSSGDGVSSFSSDEDHDDFAMRVRYRSRGEFGILLRASAGAEVRWADTKTAGAAGQTVLQDLNGLGWAVAPTSSGDWQELTVCAYGDRLAVHIDGRLVAESRDVPGPAAGRVVLQARGPEPTVIGSVELLGPARH